LIGTAKEKAGVLSFVLDDVPPEEVGKALDQEESQSAPAIIARSPSCAVSEWRKLSARRWRFTIRARNIDALVAALLRIQASQGKA